MRRVALEPQDTVRLGGNWFLMFRSSPGICRIFVAHGFALPGIGTLAAQSVFNLDVPIILGTVVFSAVIVVDVPGLLDVPYR